MRILLIGGNGFIGSPLTGELREAGHELAILHRRAKDDPAVEGVTRIQGDRNRLADCRAQLQHFAPELVVDLILSSGEQARLLMSESRQFAARVIALSSMDVYRAWGIVHQTEPGPLEPLPITEDSPLRTVRQLYPPETIRMMQSVLTWVDNHYDKIAVEEAVLNTPGIVGTVLRLPMVYGPGDPLHRFFPLLKRISDGRSCILFADDLAAWRGPRGYVDNVAHAIALAATSVQAGGRVYNVCDELALPEIEWQAEIAKQTNWTGKFVVLPRQRTPGHLLQPGNAAQHVVVRSDRIRTELLYRERVEVEEAIRRTIAWEQQNSPGVINPQQFDYVAENAALANQA
jgi:nucleoside-diphosphate-sugar epimerase